MEWFFVVDDICDVMDVVCELLSVGNVLCKKEKLWVWFLFVCFMVVFLLVVGFG